MSCGQDTTNPKLLCKSRDQILMSLFPPTELFNYLEHILKNTFFPSCGYLSSSSQKMQTRLFSVVLPDGLPGQSPCALLSRARQMTSKQHMTTQKTKVPEMLPEHCSLVRWPHVPLLDCECWWTCKAMKMANFFVGTDSFVCPFHTLIAFQKRLSSTKVVRLLPHFVSRLSSHKDVTEPVSQRKNRTQATTNCNKNWTIGIFECEASARCCSAHFLYSTTVTPTINAYLRHIKSCLEITISKCEQQIDFDCFRSVFHALVKTQQLPQASIQNHHHHKPFPRDTMAWSLTGFFTSPMTQSKTRFQSWCIFVRSPFMVWAPSSHGRVAILWFRDVPGPLSHIGGPPPWWRSPKATWAIYSVHIWEVGWMSQDLCHTWGPPSTEGLQRQSAIQFVLMQKQGQRRWTSHRSCPSTPSSFYLWSTVFVVLAAMGSLHMRQKKRREEIHLVHIVLGFLFYGNKSQKNNVDPLIFLVWKQNVKNMSGWPHAKRTPWDQTSSIFAWIAQRRNNSRAQLWNTYALSLFEQFPITHKNLCCTFSTAGQERFVDKRQR